MNDSASTTQPRSISLILAGFGGLLLSIVSGWMLLFSDFHAGSVAPTILFVATPGFALCSFAALARLRRAPSRIPLDDETRPTFNDARFIAATESSLDAFFLLDAVRNDSGILEDFRFTFLNRKARVLLELSEDRGVGDLLCDLFPSFRQQGLFEQYQNTVNTGTQSTAEFSLKDADLNARWIRSSVLKLGDGIAVTASDLTERKEAEAQSMQIAHHDRLTGLPNRALLDDRIQQSIERARRNQHTVTVLLLDLDNFRQLNERHGRAAGDHVLKTMAARLINAVRATDSVFRLGADEFVILFPDLATTNPPEDFAHKILLTFIAPIIWQQKKLSVTASIGLSSYPVAGSTPESLLVEADVALYSMKCGQTAPRGPQPVRPEFDLAVFPIHAARTPQQRSNEKTAMSA